jgi:membrane associated rhomboid family serine protease
MARYRDMAISFGPPLTPVAKRLIIFMAAVFVVTYIPYAIFHWDAPYLWLALQPEDILHRFYFWELVTYLFLHMGFFHVIFNMFALWMFGSDLESLWRSKKFLFYFFLTGIGAGVTAVLLNALLRPGIPTATVGCSGAVYGLLLAYGMIFPERPIYLYLLIPIKAKWFVLIMGLIEFVSSFSTPSSGVSNVAHLGGMLFGFLYLRGGGLPYRLQLRYHEWRRTRLRRKFEVYMRRHEKKDEAGRWIN